MESIVNEWSDFEEKVIPDGASTVQREEMRRAFFGGAAATFFMFLRIAEMSELRAIQTLESMEKELKKFAATVGQEQPQEVH